MTDTALWFTNSRMTIKLSNRENANGLSVIENVIPHGFSPPRHVHRNEAETFYILEGRFLFELDGQETVAGPGDVLHAPAGLQHSFLVLSAAGGMMLTISDGGFEDMVRSVSRPATDSGLPPQTEPTPAEQEALFEACSRNGITLDGAPLAA